MNLDHWPPFFQDYWQTHPQGRRLLGAWLVYMLVVGFMGWAATEMTAGMPCLAAFPSA